MVEISIWLFAAAFVIAITIGFFSARLYFKKRDIQNENRQEYRVLIDSFEDSQKYLSEKLHDTVGPLLAAAKMKLEVVQLKTKINEPNVKDALQKIQEAGTQLRDLIQELHPVEIETYGLKASLNVFIGKLRESTGLNINFHCSQQIKTDKSNDILLFRIISQAVKNSVSKTNCRNVDLVIHQVNGTINILLTDDSRESAGRYTDSYKDKEFIKIRKLTDTLGGRFRMKHTADSGNSLQIIIPGA